jgi:hypothetical protein
MPDRTAHPFDPQVVLVDFETHLPPWMKVISASPTDTGFARLSAEMNALIELTSPTSIEQSVRLEIVNRVQLQAQNIWPAAVVNPVGSYAHNMYTSSRCFFFSLLIQRYGLVCSGTVYSRISS